MRLPLLNSCTIYAYLRERGLLKANTQGRISVVDLSRRNHNLVVKINNRPLWFVKQIQYATSEVIASLSREAYCYQSAQIEKTLAPLHEIMPRFELFDIENSILVLEYLDGVNAAEAHQGVGVFDVQIPEILGKLVAKLHHMTPLVLQSPLRHIFLGNRPWVLENALGANYPSRRSSFLSLFTADKEIAKAIAVLQQSWHRNTLIHGDTRLENFFFCRAKDGGANLDVRLVDWELTDLGDATWDCANVMQHYWIQWISSNSPPNSQTWEGLQSTLQHFWRAYTAEWNPNQVDMHLALRYAMQVTGARLIQTSYEHFVSSGNWTPSVVRLARLARLLLTDPDSALIGFKQ